MEPLQTGPMKIHYYSQSFNFFFVAGYKKYNDMCEALAERLLDLHCRLLSLYILQDADCLDWENEKPFFESERGSYIIQMWWLYMQGKCDLFSYSLSISQTLYFKVLKRIYGLRYHRKWLNEFSPEC